VSAPTRPALRYYGGKWKLAPWIISHFPAHKNYVEPCGGAASVLLQKPRSLLETYNDLDGNVVNFFRVLRDEPDRLIAGIQLTPWAREEYELALRTCEDPVEAARRFFMVSWMSLNASTTRNQSTNIAWIRQAIHARRACRPEILHRKGNLDALAQVAGRLIAVQIEHTDWRAVVDKHDESEALFYFDPPYVASTRTEDSRYIYEWTDAQHVEAAALLRQCQGYVIVSGYACPLYAELYEAHGWQRHDREAQTNSGGKRTESLWLSPRVTAAQAQPALFQVNS
jgi:DNA adenine methylase